MTSFLTVFGSTKSKPFSFFSFFFFHFEAYLLWRIFRWSQDIRVVGLSLFPFFFDFKIVVHMNNSRENRQVPYILTSKSRYPQLKSWIWRTTCTFRTWSLDIWRAILFKPNQQNVMIWRVFYCLGGRFHDYFLILVKNPSFSKIWWVVRSVI